MKYVNFKNILQMSFANSAAALRGMIEAEGSKEKQPTGECSTCALIRYSLGSQIIKMEI